MPLTAVFLIALNLGLLWLLMAAPVGRRTIRLRKQFDAPLEKVWNAVNPLGPDADWHPRVLSTKPVDANRVEHVHANLDRLGQPISVTYQVDSSDGTTAYTARVVEDTALDPAFWRNYSENCTLTRNANGTELLIERTDRYRGVAFLIFRYFSMRRDVAALGSWLAGTRIVTSGRFEHPVTQTFLAILSTLLLWPFFGLTEQGLMLSTMLTVVIVAHELGHLAAYKSFGHKRVRMIFIPLLGGIAMGGRPYNSRFEIAVCAIMGAGLSGFLVPVFVGLGNAAGHGVLPVTLAKPLFLFLLILGAFNLLNLLPMQRFDGGQAIRQIFPKFGMQTMGSFLITGAILATGWEVGIPSSALVVALAIFVLLSFLGRSSVKPRHEMLPMSNPERLIAGLGLYAAVLIHAYAIIVAWEALF